MGYRENCSAVIIVEIGAMYFPILISHNGDRVFDTLLEGNWTYSDLTCLAIQCPRVAVLGTDVHHSAIYGDAEQPESVDCYHEIDDIEETVGIGFVYLVSEDTFTTICDADYGSSREGVEHRLSSRKEV